MSEGLTNTASHGSVTRMFKRLKQYQFEWDVCFICCSFICLFIYLGQWQLQRADRKSNIISQLDAKRTTPAKMIADIDWQSDDLAFQPIQLQGRFDNEHIFLLDNRILNGQVGFEVIQAFNPQNDHGLVDNKVVFVNRGWVPAGRTRKDLPVIEKMNKLVKIHGSVYVQQDNSFLFNSGMEGEIHWPRVVMTLDIDNFAEILGQSSYPYFIRLDELSPGAYECRWQIVNMQPEKHLAYAIQWYAMAFALAVLYLVFSTRKRQLPGEESE